MKYYAAGPAASAADPELLLSSCWPPAPDLLDSDRLSPEPKSTADILDSLLGNGAGNLAELKPLPPFTGYTGHLSINGISGHHYHAIAQRLPEENNNYSSQTNYGDNNVSSSTCGADRELDDAKVYPIDTDNDIKFFSVNSESSDSKVFPGISSDSCANHSESPCNKMFGADSCSVQAKSESYDISSMEEIEEIIASSGLADTTVPSQMDEPDQNTSRDSWMDLDAFIEGACNQHNEKLLSQDNLSEFILPGSPQHQQDYSRKMEYSCKASQDFASKSQEFLSKNLQSAGSTLQTLLTHGYMPLLQNRLQNGPPIKQEAPSSTSYGMDIISTSSPPGNVVSTTDNLLLNGRYMQHHYAIGLKPDGLCSPDHLLGNYPHTTTNTPITSKNKRNRSKQKQQQSMQITNSISFQNAAELSGLLSKEKPVHRCSICNRGFLNKSNIKVHLRTHTGEKPFRCEVCAKAFRQKAHLIKHQQIHKRIGRD